MAKIAEAPPLPTYDEALTSNFPSTPSAIPPISQLSRSEESQIVQGTSYEYKTDYIDSQPQPQCYIPTQIPQDRRKEDRCLACLECCDTCWSCCGLMFMCCTLCELCKSP